MDAIFVVLKSKGVIAVAIYMAKAASVQSSLRTPNRKQAQMLKHIAKLDNRMREIETEIDEILAKIDEYNYLEKVVPTLKSVGTEMKSVVSMDNDRLKLEAKLPALNERWAKLRVEYSLLEQEAKRIKEKLDRRAS